MKRIHGLIAIAALSLAVAACDHYPDTPPPGIGNHSAGKPCKPGLPNYDECSAEDQPTAKPTSVPTDAPVAPG